jgi:PAS domain S-box-containing protein
MSPDDYDAILQRVSDAVVVFDADWRYAYLNDRALAVAGAPREALLGRVFWDVRPEMFGTAGFYEVQRAMDERLEVRLDLHYPRTDRWLDLRAYPAPDGGLITVFTDVTDRKVRERRDRFLAALADATRGLQRPEDVIWAVARTTGEEFAVTRCTYGEIDPAEQFVTVHRDYTTGVRSIAGRHRLEDFGADVVRALKAGHALAVEDVLEDARANAPATLAAFEQIETRSVLCVPLVRGGRLAALFVLHHVHPRAWGTDVVGLVEQAAERTWVAVESARAEQALAENEQRLRLALEAGGCGVWDWDVVADRVTWSEQIYVFHGVEPGAFGGTIADFEALVHPDDRARVSSAIAAAMRDGGGDCYQMELRALRPDGIVRWLMTSGRVVRDAAGRPVRMLGATIDVTDHKAAEQERERLLASERAARRTAEAARADAERVGRMKDEFLATLSHELRTPLNAILGWAQLLRDGGVDADERTQGLETIERNARAQAQLIEDLLDMSRIITGKLRLDVRRADLPEVVAAAVRTVRPAADAKSVHVDTDVAGPVPPLTGDPDRLQQVVWNLLNNAIKFTPHGGRVQVRVRGVATGGAEVTVSDTGIGVKPEFLPHVFERFRQADASTTRAHGGLGLGLALVRHLVHMHGGTVHLSSDGEGRGTTVTVTLPPIMPAPPPESPPQSTKRADGGPSPQLRPSGTP